MRKTWVLLLLLAGCDNPPPRTVTPAETAAAPPVVSAEPETERVVAETGVGAKGRDYGGGIITEPVRQYFRAPQMVIFDIQIPHAMDLFKATHNRAPESHEEFMREIVEANNLRLPVLPPGEKYVYDPETEQLMVERPRK